MFDGLITYAKDQTALGILRSLVDIFLVYYVVYRVLLVARGTRALQVAIGLGAVFLLYVVAQLMQLVTVLTILGSLIQSILLLVVVVFQNDIRRGLQRVGSGSRRWFGLWATAQESKVIDEVVEAASDLARHRIGGLIAFEQDANLDEFVGAHKGHEIDAKVTRELLVSLFLPEATNKLHDGAVIIRNFRIAKAGVFFPMPESRVIDASFGSRHRAALGITEETDAVVVIVSEERGSISLSFNGNIAADLPVAKLRESLESIFNPRVVKKSRKLQKLRNSELPPPPEPREVEESPRISLRGSIIETPRAPRSADADASHASGRRSPAAPPRPFANARAKQVTARRPPSDLPSGSLPPSPPPAISPRR
ncbi:MAG TPA: diadenylate cyclase CdaA [Polyangiaceae bacterium]